MEGHRILIHERVDLARSGHNPTVICRMPSGWAVLGDQQYCSGYSLLLPDLMVDHLTDLDNGERSRFLADMAPIGEAIRSCTDASRVNYEILANGEPALNAHVFPRFQSEPDEYRPGPVWLYPADLRGSVPFDESSHSDLRRRLAGHITKRIGG